ncbi:MAG TPA: hypothetical protein VK879_09580 [Candidatus Sulfomarinibacteraceae bacterium]|nr:hypothetical protein [Candidatus Sulfomarinibacteraceae bacterium]
MRPAPSVVTMTLGALLCAVLVACGQQQTPTAPAAAVDESAAAPATPVVIPTLYPTNTAPASPAATATATFAPTPSPQSTVDFEQPVIEFHYQIPALALDRRLEASVGGRVTVVDETQGVAAIRENQGGILLELQEALPQLELPPVPANCESCVSFSYELPLAEASRQGWLTDTVMLASVENYTSVLLGPHFPPGTQLGLRRSATPYDVAHTLALTEEGLLWRWLATDSDVAQPLPVAEVDALLPLALEELEREALAEEYRVACTGTPVETLYMSEGAALPDGDSNSQTSLTITCPAFSLPSTLLPLYLRLDALMAPLLAEQGVPRPPLEIPLDTMVDYQRHDGARLTLTIDGDVLAMSAQEAVITDTLAAGQVISFTNALLEADTFAPGINAYVSGEADNLLLVRGPQGMVEAAWDGHSAPAAIADEVERLDELLEQLLGETGEVDEGEPDSAATATPTPTVGPEP